MRKILALFSPLLLGACASTGTSTPVAANANSPSYQYAADKAFADLGNEKTARGLASDESPFAALFGNFQKTQRFEVLVYPKLISLGSKQDAATTQLHREAPEKFQFRIDRQGHCAAAGDLVASSDLANCVQVEIKPVGSTVKGKQFVRVFMRPDYRVYGVSYHDYDADRDQVKRARKMLKWDLDEPLSSELLSLAKEMVPLDLPVHATNGGHTELGAVTLSEGPKSGSSCQGWNFKYNNSYGSRVKATWCASDAWPTVVETNRYVAVLSAQE